MEILGVPDSTMICRGTQSYLHFTSDYRPLTTTNKNGKDRIPGSKPLKEALNNSEDTFVDFIHS
jgi:hypothetical protein